MSYARDKRESSGRGKRVCFVVWPELIKCKIKMLHRQRDRARERIYFG